MGADRKGPLAAFIVVAIVAAILLITSVRSQAAPAWLDRTLPSPPRVVRALGGGLDRVVEQGVVLAHRTGLASSDASRGSVTEAGPPADTSTTATGHLAPVRHRTTRAGHPAHRSSAAADPVSPTGPSAPDAVRHGRHAGTADHRRNAGHGRHLGGTHGQHGHHEHGHHEHGHPEHGHHAHGTYEHGHHEHGHHEHSEHGHHR
ncbi:hypothetical protein [Nocardioides cynanchi]|uniref:hypothetical protein n=1 Tax=Nocardioides cynanchi TaxID=2558918 RepID=UPI00178112B2|nr:hypothetical protein [Nocardioides cynanchi]